MEPTERPELAKGARTLLESEMCTYRVFQDSKLPKKEKVPDDGPMPMVCYDDRRILHSPPIAASKCSGLGFASSTIINIAIFVLSQCRFSRKRPDVSAHLQVITTQ